MLFLNGFNKTANKHHSNRVNRAIEKKRDIHITYKKLNGRTVKRKVTPYEIKNSLLFGHDHKRGELRTYRMDRLKMVKTAIHNSFVDEMENGDTIGNKAPPAIETQLKQTPGWIRKGIKKKAESSLPRVSQPLHSSLACQGGHEPMSEPDLPKKAVRKVKRESGMLSTPPKPEQTGNDSGGSYLGSTAGDRL